MKSPIYNISQENFETILEYYNIINKSSSNYYCIIQKYKDYTNEYCSKIKELFKELKNNDEYKIINIDFNLSDENNKVNIMKKIKVSPINQSITKIN